VGRSTATREASAASITSPGTQVASSDAESFARQPYRWTRSCAATASCGWPRSRPTAIAARGTAGGDDPGPPTRESRARGDTGGAGRMITRMPAGTITLIVAVCATSACMGPSPDALLPGSGIAREGEAASIALRAGWRSLVQPSNVARRQPISPEVKVEAIEHARQRAGRVRGHGARWRSPRTQWAGAFAAPPVPLPRPGSRSSTHW